MRTSARGTGEILLEKNKDFAVFSQANKLIMRIPGQYARRTSLPNLEMVMNDEETPDKLVTSAHLPLGLTINSLNKKQTTFEATDNHKKLLQESCSQDPAKKSKAETAKRKDQSTAEISNPVQINEKQKKEDANACIGEQRRQ